MSITSKKSILQLLIVLLATLLLLSGCVHRRSLSAQYEILPDKPDGFALSKNVLLVADNQLNYLYGDPIWLRSGLSDKLVRVAIRPVQQDLFGQDILRWTLELYGSQYPIIHLGDGANMACAGEIESFIEIMTTAKQPWVMAPGNHDGYLFGNMHLNLGEWEAACGGAGGPMTKDHFVRRYLAYLKEQYQDFRQRYPEELPPQGYWRGDPDPANFLQAVAWEINEQKPWRSYVVQELNLGLPNSPTPISAILLDTSQYGTAPTLLPTPISPNAGVNGDVRPDQLKIVRKWLRDDPTGQKITIFMGHHPADKLLADARKAVESMLTNYRIPLFVSAHTHHGEYFPRGGSEGSEGWLELNVGSIVDWPIEFRTLAIHEIRDAPQRLIIRTKLFRIPDSWKPENLLPPNAPACQDVWETKPGELGYYLSYMDITSPHPEKTQDQLMDALLHTYKRFLKYVPSAEDNKIWPPCCARNQAIQQQIDLALSSYTLKQKKSFLRDLEKFDRRRKPQKSITWRDYRLCQAVWASKYDQLQRRQPVPSDTYISFPRR